MFGLAKQGFSHVRFSQARSHKPSNAFILDFKFALLNCLFDLKEQTEQTELKKEVKEERKRKWN